MIFILLAMISVVAFQMHLALGKLGDIHRHQQYEAQEYLNSLVDYEEYVKDMIHKNDHANIRTFDDYMAWCDEDGNYHG